MSSSHVDAGFVEASNVRFTDSSMVVDLTDGRAVSVPLNWFPRLLGGSNSERASWRLIGGGAGIHWPALDEDISIEDLMAGRRSGESKSSLETWTNSRPKRAKPR